MIKKTLLTALWMITLFVGINPLWRGQEGKVTGSENIRQKAGEIHRRIFTLDAHTDTPLTLLNPRFRLERRYRYSFNGPKVDLPRIREGGLDSLFFAIFVRQGQLNRRGYKNTENHVYRVLDIIHGTLKKNSGSIQAAYDPDDAETLFKKRKISLFTGLENGYALGTDISRVKKFSHRGIRYITLCHTGNNQICDSSTDPRGSFHGGLSSFGREVVGEMNSCGLMVDVSHVSDKAFFDIIKISEAPVIASHSNARSVCDHPRNMSDEMLIRLAENRGIINLSLWSGYVKKPPYNRSRERELNLLEKHYRIGRRSGMKNLQEYFARRRRIIRRYSREKPDLACLIDHVDHIVGLIGIDYIGIGTDFDGGGGLKGCLDISQVENITYELVKRGYSERDIGKIWGGNFMRVFHEVIKVSGKPE